MSDPTLTDWTPAPWRAVECDLEGGTILDYLSTLLGNREADGTSTGRAFMVLGPNVVDPERGGEVVVAFTGDGPQAEANAHRIAARATPETVAPNLPVRDQEGGGATGQDTGTAWDTRSTDCPEAPAKVAPAPIPETVALDVEEGPVTGQSLYEQHGWSGCEGSAWDNLPLATRSGWTYAAIQTYAQAEMVALDVEAVARAVLEQMGGENICGSTCSAHDFDPCANCIAAAVVAADPRHTVAEVKAEALREAADEFQRQWPVYGDDWLRDRADQIERDAATSEGVEG